MHAKTTLVTLLITMMLADSLNCLKWQAMGSGMNDTVITEIWANIGSNFDSAYGNFDRASAFNGMTKGISDRLNARWDQAWNVALVISYG